VIECTIDRERGLRIVRYEGVITDEELIAFYRELYTDSGYDPTLVEINDARAIEGTAVTRVALMEIIEIVEEQGIDLSGTRRVMVATRDAAYGLGRMYQSYREGAENFAVFRNMEEAERWLGLEPDECQSEPE